MRRLIRNESFSNALLHDYPDLPMQRLTKVSKLADVIDTGYEVSLKCHKYVTATGSVVLQPHSRY